MSHHTDAQPAVILTGDAQAVCCTLQAHHNAQTHSDEFVKSALVSLDKFSVLVGELIIFEVGFLTAHHFQHDRLLT